MTAPHEIDARGDDEFWILAQARVALLGGMPEFLALVEVDAAARRAVIAADVNSGIGAWRDACLAIEARLAAEAAIS